MEWDSLDAIALPLYEKARKGDSAAFGRLCELFRELLAPRITRRIGRRLGTHVETEDVLQETFLKAFQLSVGLEWEGSQHLFHWLACIARHSLQRIVRRQKGPCHELHLRPGPPGSSSDGKNDPSAPKGAFEDRATPPDKTLLRDERFDRLQKALGALSKDRRKAILLTFVGGLSTKEVARLMRRSRGAVRVLLLRGAKDLRESLGDTDSLHLPHRSLSLS